jgi:hypothetical protein
MRFNGSILGVDNSPRISRVGGVWALRPQAIARRENRWGGMDADAAAYIAEVETSDAQALEPAVREAIHTFVKGCKDDGIWTAIKASAILCGARTLTGALKPLVGTAPTNNNFVSGDYSRAYGLYSTGTQWLDTNRNNNADGQNDQHMACYGTRTVPLGNPIMGAGGGADTGATHIFTNATTRSRNSTAVNLASGTSAIGLIGMSRSASATYTAISGSAPMETLSSTSQTPFNQNVLVYRRVAGSGAGAGRIAFYSVGTALDLELLAKNVQRLVGSIQSALL